VSHFGCSLQFTFSSLPFCEFLSPPPFSLSLRPTPLYSSSSIPPPGKDSLPNNAASSSGPAKDIATAVAEARHAREAREAAAKQGELVAKAAAAAAAEAREQVQ
jgi:hypothetical protein